MISEEVYLSKREDGVYIKTTKSPHYKIQCDCYKIEVNFDGWRLYGGDSWNTIKECETQRNAKICHKKYEQMDKEKLSKIIDDYRSNIL